MPKNKKLMILLVFLAIYFFPLDANILLNRIGGWTTHWTLYASLLIFILIIIDGKTLKDKLKNIKKEIRNGFR